MFFVFPKLILLLAVNPIIEEKIHCLDCDYYITRNEAQQWLEENIDETYPAVFKSYYERPVRSWERYYRCENIISIYINKDREIAQWTIFDLRRAINYKFPPFGLVEKKFPKILDYVCKYYMERRMKLYEEARDIGVGVDNYLHCSYLIREDLLLLGVKKKYVNQLNEFVKNNQKEVPVPWFFDIPGDE